MTPPDDELRSTAQALVILARSLSASGYDAEAALKMEEAVAIYEGLGDNRALGQTLLSLAQVYVDAGRKDDATAPLERGLPLLKEAGAWDAAAAKWESFLLTEKFTQRMPDIFRQLRKGQQSGMAAFLTDLHEHLPDAGTDDNSHTQAMRMLSNSVGRLLSSLPEQARPQPRLPSTDEVAARDTRSLEELIKSLADSDATVRRQAALALGARGDLAAVEPLIETCRDRSQWVRMAAVRSLGKLRDTRALDALAARLEDRDKEVRRSAATALGAIGDKRAVDALTLALTDPYWRATESAEKALRKMKASPNLLTLIALLGHDQTERRVQAAHRLGRTGNAAAIPPLLAEVENMKQSLQARVAMLTALGQLKDQRAVEIALRMLESPAPGKKAAGREASLKPAIMDVITALGSEAAHLSTAATATLTAQLRDDDPYVRYAAIRALAQVGDKSAIPALEQIQHFDPDMVQARDDVFRMVRLRSIAAEAIVRLRSR